ncbi:hypothetical protein ACWEKT_30810 [Nocardia takedensis]
MARRNHWGGNTETIDIEFAAPGDTPDWGNLYSSGNPVVIAWYFIAPTLASALAVYLSKETLRRATRVHRDPVAVRVD